MSTTEEKQLIRFKVVKQCADDELYQRRTLFIEDGYLYPEVMKQLMGKELSDARALLRILLKECESHNAKIATKRTILKNLRFSKNWMSSKVFSDLILPFRAIDKLIAENSDKSWYEIYKLLSI
jgi:hypothetical protein